MDVRPRRPVRTRRDVVTNEVIFTRVFFTKGSLDSLMYQSELRVGKWCGG